MQTSAEDLQTSPKFADLFGSFADICSHWDLQRSSQISAEVWQTLMKVLLISAEGVDFCQIVIDLHRDTQRYRSLQRFWRPPRKCHRFPWRFFRCRVLRRLLTCRGFTDLCRDVQKCRHLWRLLTYVDIFTNLWRNCTLLSGDFVDYCRDLHILGCWNL